LRAAMNGEVYRRILKVELNLPGSRLE